MTQCRTGVQKLRRAAAAAAAAAATATQGTLGYTDTDLLFFRCSIAAAQSTTRPSISAIEFSAIRSENMAADTAHTVMVPNNAGNVAEAGPPLEGPPLEDAVVMHLRPNQPAALPPQTRVDAGITCLSFPHTSMLR